jgi:hypothetical protein
MVFFRNTYAFGWFGAFRGRYFSPRPLIEDGSLRSLSSLIFNALPVRQRNTAEARRAQFVQRANQPNRIFLRLAIAGRADRRRGRLVYPCRRAACGSLDGGCKILRRPVPSSQQMNLPRPAWQNPHLDVVDDSSTGTSVP